MNVVFQNSGEIDARAFSSFGVNAKETENPIGFFGTGLKYAIAVLLREGCAIKVLSGMSEIGFGLSKQNFRGKEFDFIVMTVDGVSTELGFTTELGKNWSMWCAYRELACNCLDEEGSSYYTHNGFPQKENGTTKVIVCGEPFLEEHYKRNQIILEGEPAFKGKNVSVYRQPSAYAYYRSVRVKDLPDRALFTYDVSSKMTLSEDRILVSDWDYRAAIARMVISELDDERILEQILLASSDHYEHCIDFEGWSASPSKLFLRTIERLMGNRLVKINQSAVMAWKKAVGKELNIDQLCLTNIQQRAFDKAVNFCKKMGFEVDDFPIKFVVSLGGDTIGLAAEETIFVSERVFHQGVKQLVSTLIEEYIHIKYGYEDCSRSMQTFLFDKMVSLAEEAEGEAL